MKLRPRSLKRHRHVQGDSFPLVDAMEAHLRTGIAIFNAGGYHAAHDAWEDHWLELESGTADERFLHGLIQFTAAVHHGLNGNWAGLKGLAESGAGYLKGLPATYRGVDVVSVRTYLQALAADPEHIERTPIPRLRFEGAILRLTDLEFDAIAIAADVLTEEFDAYDEALVADAVRYAREAVGRDDQNQFVPLVMDFVTDPENRAIAYQRLVEHVERRRDRESDVDGLFQSE